MPKIDYTTQKETLLKMLSKEDIAIIKKDYPNKEIRNEKIYELLKKGFSRKLLSEVTGLTYSVVWQVGMYMPSASKLSRKGLSRMKEMLDAMSNEISAILNDESKNG